MTARTHDAFAFASLVTIAAYYPPTSLNLLTLFAAIVGNNIGALIPDMDSAGNRLWDLLPAGNFLGRIFKRIFYKHRTLSHSIIGLLLIYKGLLWLLPQFLNPSFIEPKIVLYSIIIGYISHLLADSLTKEGLPLFFPFKFDFGIPPLSALRITTGKWIEKYIVFPGVWIYLFVFIYYNQGRITEIINLVTS
jgi:inner membrane protein